MNEASFQLGHYSQLLTAGDYTQLLHPTGIEWRARGVVPKGDGIIAAEHTNHETGESFWVCPGGGVEPVETIPQAVVRELDEEAVLSVQVDRLLYVLRPDYHNGLDFFVLTHPVDADVALSVGHDPEFAADDQFLTDMAVLSFDRLENDDDLVFYPAGIRRRLRRDVQHPPTRGIYLGSIR